MELKQLALATASRLNLNGTCEKCHKEKANQVYLEYIVHSIPEVFHTKILCRECALDILREGNGIWQAKKLFAAEYLRLIYNR